MAARSTDPVLRSGRREALVVTCLWLVAMGYTVGYSYLNGYGRAAEDLKFVWGFPDWVFWGIVVPWVSCALFGVWFAYGFMSDAELEPERGEDVQRDD